MPNTYTNSGSGEQNIGIGTNAIGKQVNTYNNAPQAPVEDLLKLLAEIKARLPELPEEVRDELRLEVEGAELQARKEKPDGQKIAAKLEAAKDVLAAISGTVAAALTVGELIGRALSWCSTAVKI
jgi:hypothetical protein